MKVSTRVEYGVLALADIAIYGGAGISVTALEISGRQGISKKYLEQILPLLRQAGLIRALKGQRGGYLLARSPQQILMSDVLNALDPSVLEPMEIPGGDRPRDLRLAVVDCLWRPLNSLLSDFAAGKTLASFLIECQALMPDGSDMYVI